MVLPLRTTIMAFYELDHGVHLSRKEGEVKRGN